MEPKVEDGLCSHDFAAWGRDNANVPNVLLRYDAGSTKNVRLVRGPVGKPVSLSHCKRKWKTPPVYKSFSTDQIPAVLDLCEAFGSQIIRAQIPAVGCLHRRKSRVESTRNRVWKVGSYFISFLISFIVFVDQIPCNMQYCVPHQIDTTSLIPHSAQDIVGGSSVVNCL